MSVEIRKGTCADTEQLIALLKEVKASMRNPEWFYLDPEDTVREMMQDGTMQLWVAMDRERMAAAFDILIPGLDSYNYGYELDLPEEELLRVIHMDTAAVHPDYRGQKLQSRMIRIAEEAIAATGSHILLCTVHPENRYSLRNVLDTGYTVRKEVNLYGSRRYILGKEL